MYVLATHMVDAQEYAKNPYPSSSQANTPLTIRTIDGAISKTSASELIFPNGSLAMGASDGSLSVTLGGGGGGLTVGTTTVTSGTATRLLYETSGNAVGEISGFTTNGSTTLLQTSNSSAAFESGPNGSTNPVFRLVNNTASGATGLSITGNQATQGVTLSALSSGSDEKIILASKGTAGVVIAPTGNETYALTIPAGGVLRADPLIIGGSKNGSKAGLMLGNAQFLSWDVGTNWYDGAADIALYRNAANIVEVNNGTAGQWGALKVGNRDAGVNTITSGLYVEHQSSGTPASGLGTAIALNLPSSTTTGQNAAQVYCAWNIATHASRSSFVGFKTVSNASALVDAYLGGVRTAVATDNTALSLFEIALPTLTGGSGRLSYTVYCSDGTDVQIRRGVMEYSATNKAGSYISETAIINEAASVSSGTLTATFTVTSGTNKITVQITPDTSLSSPTTYYVKWELANLSESAVSVL